MRMRPAITSDPPAVVMGTVGTVGGAPVEREGAPVAGAEEDVEDGADVALSV